MNMNLLIAYLNPVYSIMSLTWKVLIMFVAYVLVLNKEWVLQFSLKHFRAEGLVDLTFIYH